MPDKKTIELPECPVCRTNKAVRLLSSSNGGYLICLPGIHHGCGERTRGWWDDNDAIVIWARAAEKRAKLLALVPVLCKELPETAGEYWWWGGDINKAPVRVDVDVCHELDPFAINDWNYGRSVKVMGGWWAKCVAPELPEGEG